MKIDKGNPGHWLLLLRQGFYTWLGIAARWLGTAPARPRVVLYGHQLSGNLKALYAEWQQNFSHDFDCHFLSLDPEYCKALEAEGINTLRCGRLRDMLWVGRSSAMITDHGLHAMQPMVSLTSIQFIDVWHGIPYKGFTPDTFRVHHRYHEVWVSSDLLLKLYVEKFGFPAEIVFALGYARVDKIFQHLPANPSFRLQADIKQGTRLVLYAPTWKQEDDGRELFPFGESQASFIQQLNDICAARSAVLVIRSHLNASIGERQYDNVIYCPMKVFPDAESLLQETDILICDWSSISFDYLAADRPAIFLEVEPPFKNGFSLGPEYRYGKIAASMQSLCADLANTLDDPNSYTRDQAEKHRQITEAVYGQSIDGLSARRQLQHLAQIIMRKP
jgi:CDP-glycerol glycerophosphotransferase (TagB/SpsB family)